MIEPTCSNGKIGKRSVALAHAHFRTHGPKSVDPPLTGEQLCLRDDPKRAGIVIDSLILPLLLAALIATAVPQPSRKPPTVAALLRFAEIVLPDPTSLRYIQAANNQLLLRTSLETPSQAGR
jgi:hypothetical protein